MNNELTIWMFLMERIRNPFGVAGLMGNLYAESGLRPNNLQNTYEKNLGYTDDGYTQAVDNGTYDNFVNDKAGYGLAQWTYWSRKQNLINFVKSRKCSIGDLTGQLEFLWQELQGYKAVLEVLENAMTVKEASDIVLTRFERPADQSDRVKEKRAGYGQIYYDNHANQAASKEETDMSNSSLVTYKNITKNRTSPRNHAIDTITIHCIVGQWTAKQGCDYFATTNRQCSANYVVGKDGSIGLSVEEKDRSWCSSSRANDNRAVTIEVASDTSHPYAVTDAAYKALVELVADICRRNGIKELKWRADKNLIGQVDKQNMTVHRWFAKKSCPGEYLYNLHGQIAAEVNKKLGVSTEQEEEKPTDTNKDFPATPFTVQVLVSDLNYRSEPKMGDNIKGQTGKGTFTIVAVQNGWGKLKSGAGWIYLENPEYVKIKGTVAATKPTAPTPAKKSVTEVAKEVIRGKWGNGADRKKRLEAAGYNYKEVQKKVNELCK